MNAPVKHQHRKPQVPGETESDQQRKADHDQREAEEKNRAANLNDPDAKDEQAKVSAARTGAGQPHVKDLPPDPPDDETITVKKSELRQMIAEQVTAAIGGAVRVPTPGQAEADLPDAKDLNLAKTDKPVLTKQGYMVPPEAFSKHG